MKATAPWQDPKTPTVYRSPACSRQLPLSTLLCKSEETVAAITGARRARLHLLLLWTDPRLAGARAASRVREAT
jgi:hypothetical protein